LVYVSSLVFFTFNDAESKNFGYDQTTFEYCTEIKMNEPEFTRGGKRLGAGRKKSSEPTAAIRVPESTIEHIKTWVSQRATHSDLHQELDFSPIVATTELYQIPVMLERVSAGFPSPAEDYIEETVDLNEQLVQNKTATFIVRVASQSMLLAGIDINDALVVDRSLEAINDDVVIAVFNGHFTCKRYRIEGEGKKKQVWLQAENPEFTSIYPKIGDELIVWGVVTNVIKQFKRGRNK
jgi:DNA polymerase V